MGKSKRKARLEARKKKEAKQVFTVTIVSTVLLIVLLFAMYMNAA